ncbi:MAG: metallophosphoesterase, partial [Deltaproteobacteria bacterium]|nr:metallophosphoesterase [Deltaproteobacteria bacterium]
MKIASVVDIHARGKDLEALRSQFSGLLLECTKREIDAVLVGGDIFDRPSICDSDASTGAIAEVVVGAFAELARVGIPVVMIPGNHDMSGAGSKDALHVFDGMPGIQVVREPDVVKFRVGGSGPAIGVVCIPWSWSGHSPQSVITDRLARVRNESLGVPIERIVLLAHVQVVGAKMSGAFTCEPSPGKWQISRGALEAFHVDHIALGDFHARQQLCPAGGYVGAFRQTDHGEARNPAGFEIWNSDSGLAEFVELYGAPRHRTVLCMKPGDDANLCATTGEILRVRYDGVLPDAIRLRELEACGIQVEQIVDRQERVQRAEIADGILDRPSEMIDLWAAGQNPVIEPERLANIKRCYELVTANHGGNDNGNGSITIEGIGPYSEPTTLDFATLQSPIALVAPYGTGKTFLLESIMASLYGAFAWYDGSIYDVLTQGGTGDGRMELVFAHGGKKYEAIREIHTTGKTKGQKACLYELSDGDLPGLYEHTMIAGPKVGDFETAIVRMIGDRDTFLATQFLSQNRANDLCGQPGEKDLVARRRAVFNALIGADKLDAIADKAGLIARDKDVIAKDLEAQLAGEEDWITAVSVASIGLETAIDAEKAAQAAISPLERALEGLRERLRDAQGGEDFLRNQIKAHADAKVRWERAKEHVATIVVELETLETRASGLTVARDDVEALEQEKTNLLISEALLADFHKRQAWERDFREAENRYSGIQARIADLEAVPGLDEEAKTLAGGLSKANADFELFRSTNVYVAKTNDNLRQQRNEVSARLATIEGQIADTKERIAAKPETPFGDNCAPCPLFREYAGLGERLEALREQVQAAEREQDAIPADETLVDLTELRADIERCKAAKATVDAAQSTVANLEKAKPELRKIAGEMDDLRATEPKEIPDPSEAIKASHAKIEALSGAPEKVKACKQAAADADLKAIVLDKANAEAAEARHGVEATKEAATVAEGALAEREAQQATLKAQIAEAEAAVATANDILTTAVKEATRIEARLMDAERRAKESVAKHKRVLGLAADVHGLRDLRIVFGPKGVRQVLIDDAAPELETIADALFEQATGGRMRLRIATQKVLADGALAEDFSIMVKDSRGERDALRFSGGQLQLIQILFRIAVSLWVGRIRGHQPECLFLDEAFDRLGADGTEDLLRVLEYLQDQIALIVVVTHDLAIAERMRSHVRLERRGMNVLL